MTMTVVSPHGIGPYQINVDYDGVFVEKALKGGDSGLSLAEQLFLTFKRVVEESEGKNALRTLLFNPRL